MENWLPDLDLNLDKQIQSLLCYHYTIRQFAAEPAPTTHAYNNEALALHASPLRL